MHNKKFDRCNSFMLEEQISLNGELLEPRSISAYHCIYCGRSEYGTDAQPSATSIQSG